jgi:hypothetical protein
MPFYKEHCGPLILAANQCWDVRQLCSRSCPFCLLILALVTGLQEEQHEHGHGKREGKQKGQGDHGIQSTAKGSTTLCANLAD